MIRALLVIFIAMTASFSRADDADKLMAQAKEAFAAGKADQAIELAGKAIDASPNSAEPRALRGTIHSAARNFDKALLDFNKAVELKPDDAALYQRRGETHFRLAQINESIADFDRFLKDNPDQKPHHWQRGIALYYAKRYEDGQKQFEIHQTVNPQDVENAVWHFICKARANSVKAAQETFIKITDDRRVPMAQIHALFASGAGPDDALAGVKIEQIFDAVKANDPEEKVLHHRLSYAHLYLGLWYEAHGKTDKALENLTLAAEKYVVHDYMGDVARVHVKLLKDAKKK